MHCSAASVFRMELVLLVLLLHTAHPQPLLSWSLVPNRTPKHQLSWHWAEVNMFAANSSGWSEEQVWEIPPSRSKRVVQEEAKEEKEEVVEDNKEEEEVVLVVVRPPHNSSEI